MMSKCTAAFVWLVLATSLSWAETGQGDVLTVAEYRAQLDDLLTACQQLNPSDAELPAALRDLPQSWRVHTAEQEFEVPADGLKSDLRKFGEQKSDATADAVRIRIQRLRDDVDGFEQPPSDMSGNRRQLASILARPEFRDVSGPTYLDRLQQRLSEWMLRMLGSLFRSSAIPTISRYFVYGLIGLAVITLGFLVFRHIRSLSRQEAVVPRDLTVAAKDSALWLAEAREAAQQGSWRDAIHLAYWAGIAYLEQLGTWKPDRARTPREYLRLLPRSSEHRDPLMSMTHGFELAWYAKREADESAFLHMMTALEKLGCR